MKGEGGFYPPLERFYGNSGTNGIAAPDSLTPSVNGKDDRFEEEQEGLAQT